MNKIKSITVIPIECVSEVGAESVFRRTNEHFNKHATFDAVETNVDRSLRKLLVRLIDVEFESVKALSLMSPGQSVRIARFGSSVVLVLEGAIQATLKDVGKFDDDENAQITKQVAACLQERSRLHEAFRTKNNEAAERFSSLVQSVHACFKGVVDQIDRGSNPPPFEIVPGYEYAFTFFCVSLDDRSYIDRMCDLLVPLAQPWRLGVDDGLLADALDSPLSLALQSSEGCAPAVAGENYIIYASWSSLLLCFAETNEDSRDCSTLLALIIAFEIVLQASWNRSSTMSRSIRKFLKGAEKYSFFELNEYHWRALSESKWMDGALDPTISYRERELFDVVYKTSKIDKELRRLQSAVELLDRVVVARRDADEKRSQRRLQIGLGFIAILQIVGVFVKTPVTRNSDIGWWLVVGASLLLSLLLVVPNRYWLRTKSIRAR